MALTLLAPVQPIGAAPPPRCTDPGTGWCVARRFAGTVPGGELGFRFGEPLDVDGDGTADFAAGARFKKDGVFQSGEAGVWSGKTGQLIRSWNGPFENGIFGHSVLAIPDVSGDGLADVVVSAPNATVDGVMRGIVTARSPKTGAEMWQRPGAPGSQFGWDLALAGDQNRDGSADLFIGRPGTPGSVLLVNGVDGSVLHTYAPPVPTASFGWYVARLGDVDGDGNADLAVGAPPGYVGDDPPNGAAYVIGSGSGKTLQRWEGTVPGLGFGEMVTALGASDADGHGAVVVSAPGSNDAARNLVGEVHVYSAVTGAEVRQWRGAEPGELYGRMIVGAGDCDGDAIEDLAIAAPWHRVGADDRVGRVEIRSGRSGAVIGALGGEMAESWFGWHIRRAPDPDGAGRPALLIGSLRQTVDGHAAVGVVDLWVLRAGAGATASAPLTVRATGARGAATSDRR